MRVGFIVFRRDLPMTLSRRDGHLCFAGLHARSQAGPTVFTTRDRAMEAIRATNAEERKDSLEWTSFYGKLWIMRCEVVE